MILGRKTAKILGLILLMGGLAACATAPATGKRIFTGGKSLADEKVIGAQEHPKILEQFGGVYPDKKLAAYVDRIGQDLARTSELPDLGFTFTILNSDQVNAFALPGGYVYVTRGLMALAGDEAELAGVIATKSATSPPGIRSSDTATRWPPISSQPALEFGLEEMSQTKLPIRLRI